MATLVVLKTPFSASTASFFAALSTASSLRLAVVARLGAGPPGCTRRPTHHLTRDESRKTRGQDDILKPALPKPCGRGVSRFEPNSHPRRPKQASMDKNPVFTRLCRPY